MRSRKEHAFTSTGLKFLLNKRHLDCYLEGDPRTVISTHIAPTSKCNLRCKYCSVRDREQQELSVVDVHRYLSTLVGKGLSAVILTGGGEPLMHPQINNIMEYSSFDLKWGLITNGTVCDRAKYWHMFEWVRVSYNGKKCNLDTGKLKPNCVVGVSVVNPSDDELAGALDLADQIAARYVRVVPDCNDAISEDNFMRGMTVEEAEAHLCKDSRVFLQKKLPRQCDASVCHQAYFRPYLHESGYVYPCDSVTLHSDKREFLPEYALCHCSEVGQFLREGPDRFPFRPFQSCSKCVFADTVEMLDVVKKGVEHVEFP